MNQHEYKQYFEEEVGLPVAPYSCNIHKSEEIVTRLAQLILDNLHIDKWVFKINEETQGRGLAYLDLNTIKAFKSFKAQVFASNKSKNSNAKKSYIGNNVMKGEVDWYPKLTSILLKKLPGNLQIVRRKLYDGFKEYIDIFCERGGMIEASPCIVQKDIGSPAISFFIEPDGGHFIIGTFEKIHAGLMIPCGFDIPQRSLPELNVNF